MHCLPFWEYVQTTNWHNSWTIIALIENLVQQNLMGREFPFIFAVRKNSKLDEADVDICSFKHSFLRFRNAFRLHLNYIQKTAWNSTPKQQKRCKSVGISRGGTRLEFDFRQVSRNKTLSKCMKVVSTSQVPIIYWVGKALHIHGSLLRWQWRFKIVDWGCIGSTRLEIARRGTLSWWRQHRR